MRWQSSKALCCWVSLLETYVCRDHFTWVNLKNGLWASVKHLTRMLVSLCQARKPTHVLHPSSNPATALSHFQTAIFLFLTALFHNATENYEFSSLLPLLHDSRGGHCSISHECKAWYMVVAGLTFMEWMNECSCSLVKCLSHLILWKTQVSVDFLLHQDLRGL